MLSRMFGILFAAAAFMAVALATPQTAMAEPYAQGPKTCQECHSAEYELWEETQHFKSFRTVHKKAEAKKIAVASGGKKSMKKNAVCIMCHYTAVQKKAGAKAKPKAGTSCESCHGASSDWLDVHNDYGGASVKREDETAEHKAERQQAAVDAGMTWSFMKYEIAENCMSCHGLARDELEADALAKMLGAGHPLNPDFELVAYSQGSVRHRFYPPDMTNNAEMNAAELSETFIQGQAAKLVSAIAALGKSDDAKYQEAQQKRASDATAALSAVSLPEAAALVADPTRANALALVAAIAGMDLSGEVGGLLPDPGSYKPTFPIYHPNSWKSYHFPTAKGTVSPMQPSDGMILVIGPRLEGHSVIFLAIQTHLSCRFLLAVDSLGLRRSRSSSQIINQAQDFPEQVPRHRHLSQLERNVAAMSDNLGPDLHQLVAQRRHRPVLHLLRQSQCPHEVAQIVGQGVKLEPNGIVAELAT